jgi:phospholipase D1/2
MDSKLKRRLVIAAGVVAALVAALTFAWRKTALAELVTVDRVVAAIEAASGTWWAALLLVLAFTPAAVILFPRMLLTLAAAIVFGPVKGFLLAMAGVLVSTVVLQAIGRRVGADTVRRMAGPRLDRLTRLLERQGFMAIAAVGFLPVAPFAVEMIVAGALRIPLMQLLPGVAIAHLPGTVFTTLLGDQALAALTEGRQMNRAVVFGVVACFTALAFWTHRRWRRVQAELA